MKRSVKLQVLASVGLFVAACCMCASKTHAQTWDGGGTDNNWSTDLNWDTNVEPVNNGTADIIFDGATRPAPNVDVNWSINSTTFAVGASAFTVGGNQLTIQGGGVTNNSAVLQTINNAVVLGAPQSWNAAAGDITFGGTVNNGGNLLTITGGNTTRVNGAISGAGGLTKSGAGTLILGAANSFSGPVTLTAGTIQAGAAGSLPNVAYTINGGTLDLNNFATTMSSLSGGGGNISMGTGTLTVNQAGNTTYSGNMSSSGAGAVCTKQGAGTLTLSGNNNVQGGFVVSAGTLQAGSADGLTDGVAYTVNGGTLDLNDFALSASSLSGTGGTVDLGTAALTVNQSTDTTYAGVITGTGQLVKQGTGKLTLSGANNYSGTTTVSAGTLEGTTTSLQGAITNNAIVTFNQSTNGTYAGVMSGTGVLRKEGTGRVILTGANTYNGGTVVAAGALEGNTTSLQGNITVNSGADLTFNQTADGTYAGVISDAGSVTKTGAAKTTFTGTQTYTGGTNINQGTLELGANDVLANTGAVNVSGGTLDINTRNDTVGAVTLASGTITGTTGQLTGTSYAVQGGTIDAILTGGGVLTKSGAGTTTVTKAQTYTGGTNITAGTLAIGAGGGLNDVSAVNVNGGTFALGANNDTVGAVTLASGSITGTTGQLTGASYAVQSGTISANLDGNGALTKTGTGTVTLSGNNSTIGAAAINAGRLDVTGTTTTPTATVGAAGTLGGTGIIDGAVVNNGRVSAGTSGTPFGALEVGSYSTNGGITNVNIDDSDNVSQLNVNGNANLNGGDVAVNAAAGTYNAGQKFTFMTTGTRTGQFDGITDNIAGLDAVLGYDGGEVFFTLLRNGKTYEAVGRTRNQRSVGAYLDQISPNASGDLQTVLNGINVISDSQARVAYDQLGGAVHGTLAQVGLQNTTLVINQITSRVRSMPYTAGSPGGGMVGCMAPDVMDLGAASSDSASPVTLVNCGPDGCGEEVYGCNDYSGCGPTMCCRKTTWSPWAQGFGLGGAAKSDGNASGIEYSMGGVVGGIERWVDDRQLVGWWGGYIGSNVVNDGDQKINGGQFGAYIFTQYENSYTTWLAGAEFDSYQTRRHLDFDGIDRFASADSDGWQGFAYWEHGLAVETCTEVFQPFVALQYVFLRQNSFQESGADSVNLNGDGSDTNSLRGMLGARLQHVLYNHNGRRTLPEVHAMWLHEFLDTNTVLNAQFAGAPGAGGFAVSGLDLGRDWAVLGCNFTWEMHDCWSMFVNYDCQTNSQQTFHVGSGGVGHVW